VAEDREVGSEAKEPPAAKSAASRKIILVALGIVGAGAGAWLGGPLLSPLAGVFAGGGGGGHGEAEEGGGGHGGGAQEPVDELLQVEDLVVNPAGSGGTRFLVAAVSLDADPEAQEELTARNAEARDLLLTALASRTVDELSDVAHREEIREQLKGALNTMLGYEGVHRVFFPQFVIQ
jgi:flagellar FliL protein